MYKGDITLVARQSIYVVSYE